MIRPMSAGSNSPRSSTVSVPRSRKYWMYRSGVTVHKNTALAWNGLENVWGVPGRDDHDCTCLSVHRRVAAGEAEFPLRHDEDFVVLAVDVLRRLGWAGPGLWPRSVQVARRCASRPRRCGCRTARRRPARPRRVAPRECSLQSSCCSPWRRNPRVELDGRRAARGLVVRPADSAGYGRGGSPVRPRPTLQFIRDRPLACAHSQRWRAATRVAVRLYESGSTAVCSGSTFASGIPPTALDWRRSGAAGPRRPASATGSCSWRHSSPSGRSWTP